MVGVKRLAVIPARGGSKRIERKNIIDFCGKPLIAWTIEAALSSNLFDDIVVSTDDEEIAAIARQYGASVPFLREVHADDHTPISVVTRDVLEQLKLKYAQEYDSVTQLMANCPLRNALHIKQAMKNFEASAAPAQITCFRYGWMNPWWAVQLNHAAQPTPIFTQALKKRSQDLPPLYCPTGAIWIANSESLLESNTFYCPNHIFWELPWKAAIDIDDEEDLEMARMVFQDNMKHLALSEIE